MNPIYQNLYTASGENLKASAVRKLKRLKILLIAWILSLVFVIIWFTISPSAQSSIANLF